MEMEENKFARVRKEIEHQAEQSADSTACADFKDGFREACIFAIQTLEDESPSTKETQSIDLLLDRISRMETQIEVVKAFAPGLMQICEKWEATLEDAWTVINDRGR